MDITGDQTLAAIIDAAPDGMFIVDVSGTIRVANQRAGELFGRADGALVGRSIDELVPEVARDAHREHRRRFHKHPAARSMGIGMLLEALLPDGSVLPVEVSLSPVTIDGEEVVIVAVRDVSVRIHAEREVAIAADRARIARDLHDTVIQRLFASGLALEALAAQGDDSARLHEVVADLDATIRGIRNAIFDLENLETDAEGVRGRIEEIIDRVTLTSDLDVEQRFDGLIETIAPSILAELLPSLREAVSNVVRHAGASRVSVSVQAGGQVGEQVVLRVRDDGRGIGRGPDAQGESTKGYGVKNLLARADRIGGWCTIRTVEPSGTEVIWSVPA